MPITLEKLADEITQIEYLMDFTETKASTIELMFLAFVRKINNSQYSVSDLSPYARKAYKNVKEEVE